MQREGATMQYGGLNCCFDCNLRCDADLKSSIGICFGNLIIKPRCLQEKKKEKICREVEHNLSKEVSNWFSKF